MKHASVTFLRTFLQTLSWPAWVCGNETDWYRDPLTHPDIARMSPTERADLQFRPERIKAD